MAQSPSCQCLVETAREEAERLNRLVGDLLDMTRLESGALQVKHEACDVQDLARIFDKFYRVQRPEQVTGTGLAISKGIIEAHGGHIWASTREGGGAVITFALPLEVPR